MKPHKRAVGSIVALLLVSLAVYALLSRFASQGNLSIQGISIGMTREEARKRLGMPHKVDGLYEAYLANSGIIEITFDGSGAVDIVSGFNTTVEIRSRRFGPDASIDEVASTTSEASRNGRTLTFTDESSVLEVTFSDKLYSGLRRRRR